MLKRYCIFLYFLFAGLYLFAQAPQKEEKVRLESNVPAIFTVNHVIINPQPDAPETTVMFKLKPNEPALIKVEAIGYQNQWRTITVVKNEGVRVESFFLEPVLLPCLFTSPNGKSITIKRKHNNSEVGKTPCYDFIEAGSVHTFKASADGYHDEMITIDATDGHAKFQMVNLKPSAAALSLSSSPEDVSVTVNGIAYGTTPCTKNNLKPGSYTIMFSKEGYISKTTKVDIAEGEEKQVHVTLGLLPASLRVVSIPEGARVYVDSVYRGSSNLVLENLEPAAITVSVEKQGYVKASRPLVLSTGEETFVEFRLQQAQGKVAFSFTPAEVDVFVDRKHKMKTAPLTKGSHQSEPIEIELPVGKHQLSFDAKFYKESIREVEIKENQCIDLGQIHLEFAPNIKISLKSGATYTGALIEENHETLRVMTRPGMIIPLPIKDIRTRERINVPKIN